MTKYVNEVFGDTVECTEDELATIFLKLGMIEPNKRFDKNPEGKFQSVPIIEELLPKWELKKDSDGKSIYRTSEIHKIYLQVAQGQILTPFHQVLKAKLLIAMANEKRPFVPEDDPNKQFTTATQLTQTTLDRLCKPHEIWKEPDLSKDENYKQISFSEDSKRILLNSKNQIASLPIPQI